MMNAQELTLRHDSIEKSGFSAEEKAVSDRLREEINRLCRIDGGQEIIEKCQEEALNKLDAYLQTLKARKKSL